MSGAGRLDRIEEQCIKELARVDNGTISWLSGKVNRNPDSTLNAVRRCKRLELVESSPDERFWSLTQSGKLLRCYLDTETAGKP